jgi:cytochrome d ubiquinol oxidase subunit II
VTLATFSVQPLVLANLRTRPWTAVFPVLAVAALAAVRVLLARGRVTAAFRASCGYIAGMLASVSAGIYPYVLPARSAEHGLTLHDTAAPAPGLRSALFWWLPGIALAAVIFTLLYRRLPASIVVDAGGEGEPGSNRHSPAPGSES